MIINNKKYSHMHNGVVTSSTSRDKLLKLTSQTWTHWVTLGKLP